MIHHHYYEYDYDAGYDDGSTHYRDHRGNGEVLVVYALDGLLAVR